jgi:competence protein ComEC
MAGASATVVRASVMAILAMLAAHVHRPHTIERLLTIAAFVMVCVNPFVLVFDAGFQLSFLATIGLIMYAPLFERWFSFVPARYELRSIVAATFATQLTVLPLLLYQVGQASLVAPIVNVLVLPAVPLVMALTFVAGTLGTVSGVIALPFAWPAHVLLAYMFSVVDLFSQVPFAAVSLPLMSWWCVVLFYILLAGVTVIHKHRTTLVRAV